MFFFGSHYTVIINSMALLSRFT